MVPTMEQIQEVDPDRVLANLRGELARRHITQRQMADILDMPESTVSERMTGAAAWRLPELLAIAARLGVNLPAIFAVNR